MRARKVGWMFFYLVIMLSSASGQTSLDKAIGSALAGLVETYRHLHSHPELSYREKETSAYLARELRALGYKVTENVGRYTDASRRAYGVVAVLENGEGPAVMVRTDMDALPVQEQTGLPYASQAKVTDEAGEQVNVMHACGHDMHMAAFLGTARMLTALKEEWKGTLVLIAQPAEERGAGARAMLEDGLYQRFPRPDYALALHVKAELAAGKIGYSPGYALASVDSVDIKVRGMGGHGAWPHRTKDPVVLASQIVLALQTIVSREISPLDSGVVTVGSIHGGTKHNIIPDEVHLQLTVRSYKPEVRQQILDSVRRISEGLAAAAGIPPEKRPAVTLAEEEFTPATYNDPSLTERLVPWLQEVLGTENVVRVDPVMGGEDFSRYSLEDRRVPICLFWLGAVDPALIAGHEQSGRPLPSLHSSQFAPVPEPTLRTGVEAMTVAVLRLMGPGR